MGIGRATILPYAKLPARSRGIVSPSSLPYWTPPILSATVMSDTRIDLSWTGTGNLSLERSDDGGGTYSEIATILSGTNTYSNTGLTAGTTYYYRARFYK
jgi:hypothetical protein